MSRTDKANENYEELFPDHTTTLTETDPELVEIFDSFTFDDVQSHGDLDDRTRLMVQLASMVASHAVGEYRVMLDGALNVGVTPVEAKEIVYQAVPYVGMATTVDFVHATNDVLTERGVELPLPGQSTTTREDREEKGREVQERIVGEDTVADLYDSAPDDEMHIQRYLSAHCFGDHYTRDGLDVPTRELLTFSVLVALGGCDSQVEAHANANLNVGNTRSQLVDVLTQLLPFVGYPRMLNGLQVLDEVAPPSDTDEADE